MLKKKREYLPQVDLTLLLFDQAIPGTEQYVLTRNKSITPYKYGKKGRYCQNLTAKHYAQSKQSVLFTIQWLIV